MHASLCIQMSITLLLLDCSPSHFTVFHSVFSYHTSFLLILSHHLVYSMYSLVLLSCLSSLLWWPFIFLSWSPNKFSSTIAPNRFLFFSSIACSCSPIAARHLLLWQICCFIGFPIQILIILPVSKPILDCTLWLFFLSSTGWQDSLLPDGSPF